ncbi:MAG TPA: arginase [Clostridiaceae bacterium]|nr:arginase [Clostridiaceae bacterium]
MKKCLLSVDWDYFIYTCKDDWGSLIENSKSLVDLWYKRYLQEKARGRDIQASFRLSSERDTFWKRIKERFCFDKDTKAYVTDSHVWSYRLAKETNCRIVCLFDAHSDLGYGGLSALSFEVNCSNWLGKLLKEKQVYKAHIFYSPYTREKPEHFKPFNKIYNISYDHFEEWDENLRVSVIHICRSGAWTPPWLDNKFYGFIEAMGLPYAIIDCPKRIWKPENISLSDQINYLMA